MTQPISDAVDFELRERAMDEAPIGITISDPDRSDNPLVYSNDAFERLTGYAREEVLGRNCRFLQGDETDPEAVAELREAIEDAEPTTVELRNYRRDGEPFWNEVTVAPLRNDDGALTNFVGFQVDVTERKAAQMSLAAERARLDGVVDRINGLLADVTELLMHGVDREETERAIVERIAATDAYEAAWIGEPDLTRHVLVTSSVAGFDTSSDGGEIDIDGSSPAARAYAERTVVVGSADGALPIGLDGRSGTLAAVPLDYGDAVYGVLAVVSADAEALDDREQMVLSSVGRTIATAINAAQSRRGLTADDLAELEFAITDDAFFLCALADAWNCRIERRGSTARADGGLRLFVDIGETRSEELGDHLDIDGVDGITPIGGPDGTLVEVDLAPGSVVDRLAERGAEVGSLVAEDGVTRLSVLAPAEVGGRVILELLERRFDGVELLAYRERERRPTTRAAFIADLHAQLTERQEMALKTAYYSGYYDDPRTTTGDKLAAAMGVSRPTFHQHLRTAERKLIAATLE